MLAILINVTEFNWKYLILTEFSFFLQKYFWFISVLKQKPKWTDNRQPNQNVIRLILELFF